MLGIPLLEEVCWLVGLLFVGFSVSWFRSLWVHWFQSFLATKGPHKRLLNRDLLLLIYNRLIKSQQQMLLQVPELIPSSPFTNPLLEFFAKCSWSSLGKFLHNPLSNLYLCQWNMLSELAGAFLQGPMSNIHCKSMKKCSWSILGQILQVPPE